MSIYLNNGATTWPKPPEVARAMSDFLLSGGANLARGAAAGRDLVTLDLVMDTRERLANFFGGYQDGDPRYVTFTSNVTESLNVVLKGLLHSGGRVVTTSMEHNAIIRPLRSLEARGVDVDILACGEEGMLDPDVLRRDLACRAADLVVLSHASNVCGSIQPLEEIAGICRQSGVPLVVDAAQTAGLLPLRVRELGLSALCFTGHKGLMGPQGIGGIVWEPATADRCAPFVEGGTGSFSHLETQPEVLPDKFESGTPNLPGVAGLRAAVMWLQEVGMEVILEREESLGALFLEGIRQISGWKLYGRKTMSGRLPVFAMNLQDGDNGLLAQELSERWDIETRPGLHCAPLAHRTLGSFPEGALRISPGYFNTEEDVAKCLEALGILAAQ